MQGLNLDTHPVTSTIIAQLGGARIFRLAFSRAVVDEHRGAVTLEIAGALVRLVPGRASHVRVTLDAGSDTYNVELVRIGKLDKRTLEIPPPVVTASQDGVYCDVLASTVERMTGLYLKL